MKLKTLIFLQKNHEKNKKNKKKLIKLEKLIHDKLELRD
jgi:hypothetical protein